VHPQDKEQLVKPLIRVTKPTLAILGAIAEHEQPIWGLALAKQVGLATGTVYPILDRLTDLGWVSFSWDTDESAKGPRRKFYSMTTEAREAALALVKANENVPTRKGAKIGVQQHA
jgi:DNA-binding PadR family transcriptional regulator